MTAAAPVALPGLADGLPSSVPASARDAPRPLDAETEPTTPKASGSALEVGGFMAADRALAAHRRRTASSPWTTCSCSRR